MTTAESLVPVLAKRCSNKWGNKDNHMHGKLEGVRCALSAAYPVPELNLFPIMERAHE